MKENDRVNPDRGPLRRCRIRRVALVANVTLFVFVIGLLTGCQANQTVRPVGTTEGTTASTTTESTVTPTTIVPEIQNGAIQIDGNAFHVAVLTEDGNVKCYGMDPDKPAFDVEDWTNVTQVAADNDMTIAVRDDGTVVITDPQYGYKTPDLSSWTNVREVGVGRNYAVALLEDGSVIGKAFEPIEPLDPEVVKQMSEEAYQYVNAQYIMDGFASWTNIIDISAAETHVVGLKEDGTVVTSGKDTGDISAWQDIVAVDAGKYITVGLKSDGTVVAAGNMEFYQSRSDDHKQRGQVMVERVSEWTDITMVSAGMDIIVGLKSDGTVLRSSISGGSEGTFSASEWQNIVAVTAWNNFICGIQSDGTIIGMEAYMEE